MTARDVALAKIAVNDFLVVTVLAHTLLESACLNPLRTLRAVAEHFFMTRVARDLHMRLLAVAQHSNTEPRRNFVNKPL